jgi:hypothetical protein
LRASRCDRHGKSSKLTNRIPCLSARGGAKRPGKIHTLSLAPIMRFTREGEARSAMEGKDLICRALWTRNMPCHHWKAKEACSRLGSWRRDQASSRGLGGQAMSGERLKTAPASRNRKPFRFVRARCKSPGLGCRLAQGCVGSAQCKPCEGRKRHGLPSRRPSTCSFPVIFSRARGRIVENRLSRIYSTSVSDLQ